MKNKTAPTPRLLAVLVAAAFAAPTLAQTPPAPGQPTEVGTIAITGEGDRLGAGNLIQEDTPKARSTATRAAIDKQRATSNPYQSIQFLPGVNTFSHDATGLFGGGLRVRGFNSDQMGFTVDGAPVNDSGSFSVFPQQYTDAENTCEVFVTQGSSDNDAPHVGATGGNVGIVTCDPLERHTVKLTQTLGQLSLMKTYVRFDTGKLDFANGWSSFISYSKAKTDKFKGPGEADRDHVDFKSIIALPGGSRLAFTALWNEAINHNYRTATKAQFAANPDFDFSETFLPNPAGGPGRQVAPTQDTYYELAINPFRNAIVTAKANINVGPAMRIDVEPYFWYGYGTGGTQQFLLNEGGTFRGGVEDINRDGDRLDQVLVYRSSLTQTHRPGATVKGNLAWENHRVAVGYWFERARHRQTGPATRVDGNAVPDDLWLEDSLILRGDGTPYNLRDQMTISRAGSLFLHDSIGFLNDRLNVQLGVKRAMIERDYDNNANEGTGQNLNYRVRQRFEETLPSIGVKYQLTDAHQVFVNVAKNFKAPGNFAYQGAIIGGVSRIEGIAAQLRAETSVNADLGYRYFGKSFTFSGSLFAVDFKDRLARGFNPVEGITVDANVGDSTLRGFELEAGTAPVHGWSLYGSLAYTKSELDSDLRLSATNTQPTAGKQFPDTPKWLAAVTLQYANGPFFANAQVKYTGKRFATLTNDESVPSYTLLDLNAGYRFASMGWLRNPTIRANVSNVTDEEYLASNAGSGSLFTTNATGTGASSPSYYRGAPRFASLSLSAEF